jgi:hypothetical protein
VDGVEVGAGGTLKNQRGFMIKIVVKIVPLRLRSTNAIWRKPTIGSAALTERQQPRPQRWRTLHKFEQVVPSAHRVARLLSGVDIRGYGRLARQYVVVSISSDLGLFAEK